MLVLKKGAISLAIEDVTRMKILPDDHELNFVVAETYGEEEESILQTAQLWMHNVTAYSTLHWIRNLFLKPLEMILHLHILNFFLINNSWTTRDVRSWSADGSFLSSTNDLLCKCL